MKMILTGGVLCLALLLTVVSSVNAEMAHWTRRETVTPTVVAGE